MSSPPVDNTSSGPMDFEETLQPSHQQMEPPQQPIAATSTGVRKLLLKLGEIVIIGTVLIFLIYINVYFLECKL